jgi:hypothetical protein
LDPVRRGERCFRRRNRRAVEHRGCIRRRCFRRQSQIGGRRHEGPGYETPGTQYVVANPTSIYSDHFFYGTKVTGELKRGDRVEALAKVKDWDWVLVGKGGTGIGYVSISMLAPADKFIP